MESMSLASKLAMHTLYMTGAGVLTIYQQQEALAS